MPSFWCCCDDSPPVVPTTCAGFAAGTVPEFLQVDVPTPTWVNESGTPDFICRVGDNCSDQILPVDAANLNGSRVLSYDLSSSGPFDCTWTGWRNYCKADSTLHGDAVLREVITVVVGTGPPTYGITITQTFGAAGSLLEPNRVTWFTNITTPPVDVSAVEELDDVSVPFSSQSSQPYLFLGNLRNFYPVDVGAALAAHLYVSNGPETHTNPAVACSI